MTKPNNDPIRLRFDYENACNAYLKAFCEKHGYDYEDACWIGDDAGGIAEVCDYCIGTSTIRTDIDQNAPEGEFITWYDYCLRLGMLSTEYTSIPTPNFDNWLRGCPRKSEDEIAELERRHREIQQMKEELEQLLRNNKN